MIQREKPFFFHTFISQHINNAISAPHTPASSIQNGVKTGYKTRRWIKTEINFTYLSIGSVASFSLIVAYGTPSTWSIICTNPLVTAISGCSSVALTPAPSTVTVWLLSSLVITLKYKKRRPARVGTWKIYNKSSNDSIKPNENTQNQNGKYANEWIGSSYQTKGRKVAHQQGGRKRWQAECV